MALLRKFRAALRTEATEVNQAPQQSAVTPSLRRRSPRGRPVEVTRGATCRVPGGAHPPGVAVADAVHAPRRPRPTRRTTCRRPPGSPRRRFPTADLPRPGAGLSGHWWWMALSLQVWSRAGSSRSGHQHRHQRHRLGRLWFRQTPEIGPRAGPPDDAVAPTRPLLQPHPPPQDHWPTLRGPKNRFPGNRRQTNFRPASHWPANPSRDRRRENPYRPGSLRLTVHRLTGDRLRVGLPRPPDAGRHRDDRDVGRTVRVGPHLVPRVRRAPAQRDPHRGHRSAARLPGQIAGDDRESLHGVAGDRAGDVARRVPARRPSLGGWGPLGPRNLSHPPAQHETRPR